MRKQQLLRRKLISQVLISVCLLPIIWGCQISRSDDSPRADPRENCQEDSSFVWIPGGEAILGSDRQERDFAYRISAEAITQQKPRVSEIEKQLRQVGWFNHEQSRQAKLIDGYCLSRNLVTNQEYREFILATNHPAPFISEADYQEQGFLVHRYSAVKSFLWNDKLYPQGREKHPVVLISYPDALAYAKWKEKQTEAKYLSLIHI